MKKLLLAALLLAALPRMGAAQVEKQVEVTKAYVPRVGSAAKLPVEPDMTDTTRIRPEIDYTITPLSLQTTLTTRPIRPATVTYWEFNRPQPFYLKAGAGYPLNSVLDFYASTQNPSTGYLIGYVNHEGRYADIENDFGGKYNSLRMYNRAGVAAGKYLGRHVLEGELSYDNRMFHRYGAWATPGLDLGERDFEPGRMNDYGDARLNVRIGDDFQNLERTNFEVGVGGSLFFDHSERDFDAAYGQTSLTACGRIARAFGRHMLSAGVGYDYLAGRRDLDGSNQQTIRAGLRYGIDGDVIRMEIGADFYHDRVESAADPDPIVKTGNYVIPYAHFDINLGTRSLKPFIEIDGDVRDNSFRSLAGANPFLSEAAWLDRSSVDYNGRFGVGGTLGRDRFAYRLYAGFTIHDNRVYWFAERYRFLDASAGEPQLLGELMPGVFRPMQGRQTVTSFNGELEYRPTSALKFDLGLHGYIYNDEERWANASPSFEGNVGVTYAGRKIGFGVEAVMQSCRTWNVFDVEHIAGSDGPAEIRNAVSRVEVPFGVDLRVHFDWHVSNRVTLFAEGRNLINRKLYEYLWYPELGAHFTAGVKLNF